MPDQGDAAAARRFGRHGRRAATAAAIVLAALLGAAMPAAAAAQFEFEDYVEVDPPRPLRAPIARWAQAFDSDDAARIALEYAPQGWLKLPCAPAAFGRAAIAEAWREALSLSPASLSLHPSAFEMSRGGDMAIERGWAQLMQNVGGLPYATNVDYIRLWSRAGGTWRVAADVFAAGGPCAETES